MIPACFRTSTALIQRQQYNVLRLISTGTNSTPTSTPTPSSSAITQIPKFPEAPDPLSCCGSGCIKCVWIQYADEVIDYFNKRDDQNSKADQYKAVENEMEKHIEDENLRAYLLMEVKSKFSKH